MPNESGEWIMKGLGWDDPYRIRTADELINYINQVGFLPLFANEVPGFSCEDHVFAGSWWSGNPQEDPWEWRHIIAESGKVAYGKFFNKKAGYISLEWLPVFANYRRDGYDFDARWEDGLGSHRAKKIIDLFETNDELFSYEIKKFAGFGKEGEKNFEGTATELQMQTYLVTKDFRRRKKKSDGSEYGWPVSVYTTPEKMWGYGLISSSYNEEPSDSLARIINRVKEEYPWADEKDIKRVIK